MNVKVKICGIRSFESAEAVIEAGADFIGLNFAEESKRFVDKEKALEICKKTFGKIKRVGVFKNHPLETVNNYADYLGLNFVQLHGDESPNFCQKIKTKVIKTFSLPSDFDFNKVLEKMKKYNVDYFLLDRKEQGKGEMLDLKRVNEIAKNFPVFLAGGLNPYNVINATRLVIPYAVDVASGIETDGQFDETKLKEFIQKVKNYNDTYHYSGGMGSEKFRC